MARATVVPKGSTKWVFRIQSYSKNGKPTAEPKLPKTPCDGNQNVTVNDMGSFMKKPVAEALSEELVSIISDSRRKDTMNRPGESRLVSWCRERACHPFYCSLNPVFEFLTELLHKRLEYDTICSYRSAISTNNEPIGPFSVVEHPRMSGLMTRIFNNGIPQNRYCFIWDIEKDRYPKFRKVRTKVPNLQADNVISFDCFILGSLNFTSPK